MKTTLSARTESAAFTMIEMIGVLAVMAILAGVIAPNVLRSIDRAAITAETQTAHNFGTQVKKYLHDYGTLPPAATWSATIAAYSEVSPTDVLTNKRLINRVYFLDPAAPTQRALILSSMKAGLALPAAVNNVQFNQIWSTQDGSVPPGWAAAWAGWGEYLVIERINLTSEYRTIVLQNKSDVLPSGSPTNKTVSYRVYATAVALPLFSGTILPGPAATRTLPNLVQDERVVLYSDSTYATLDYTYVVTTSGRTFDFTGASWTAP